MSTANTPSGSGKPDDANRCNTKYPIVMLHGIGYRDDMFIKASWGRIPDVLRAAGARVFLGGLDAWNSHENNAAMLKPKIEAILAETGAAKVNLIGHSKGGLEGRYLISKLDMGTKVASLTTLCTPHRGTAVADWLGGDLSNRLGMMGFNMLRLMTQKLGFKAFDLVARITGDKRPEAGMALKELTRAYLEEFNKTVPDAPGVYYQSYGAAMKQASDDPVFAASYLLLLLQKAGENDGMVPVDSCRWGNFRGLIASSDPSKGLSHADIVDYRGGLLKHTDITQVYVGIVEELKQQGF